MDFNAYIKEMINKKISNIQQGLIAEIDKFDGEKMTADIIPLLSTTDSTEEIFKYPKLADVPVGFIWGGGDFYIRPFYKKGDLVWVTFSSYGINNAIKGNNLLRTDSIKNDLSYCMVSHGIAKDGFTPPATFNKNGLIIGKGDNTYIIFNENESIEMKTQSGHYKLDSAGKHDWNDGAVTLEA